MFLFSFPVRFTPKLVAEYEQRCYPDASHPLVFQYRDRPPAYQILGEFEGVKPLVEEFDLPKAYNAQFCLRWSGADELLKTKVSLPRRFKDYSVERFGLRIQPFPIGNSQSKSTGNIKDSATFVSQPRYWVERDDYLVQVCRTRVFAFPVKDIESGLSNPLLPSSQRMHVEERWHRNRGTTRNLFWAEPRVSRRQVDQFVQDALRLLYGYKRIGRPPGTKKFNCPDEFKSAYRKAYLNVARRKDEPTRPDIATELGISLSTFIRRLSEYDLPFPPDLT
jgi:hypothetical protein